MNIAQDDSRVSISSKVSSLLRIQVNRPEKSKHASPG